MAVIRQRQQAFQRRIGVVNLDTGASQVGESMSRMAQSISSAIEPFARDEAIKRGTNVAKEIKRQNLITFNDDGTPVGITAPREFGLVARQAYEQVAERRFNESMLEELENKSIELAKKYPNPKDYDTMYSKYLNSMDNAASGRFAEYIANEGGNIFSKTRAALEIEAEKKRLANAKAAAKYNTFRRLRELERSRAMSVTSESVVELSTYAQDAQLAAQEEFALTGDRVEYIKTLDEINSQQAGATVNLLINSAKFVSDSQREIIGTAIKNPSFISMIDDAAIRRQVSAVHQLSGGLGLDKLGSAFEAGANAIEAIETDLENEWMASQASAIENLESQQFETMGNAITAWQGWLSTAPETAEKDARSKMLTGLSDLFIGGLVNSYTEDMKAEDMELLALNIQSVLKSGSVDALNRIKSGRIRKMLEDVAVLDKDARDLLASNIEAAMNPETGAVKLLEEIQTKIDDDERINNETIAATAFNRAEAEINLAIEQKDYAAVLSAFEGIDPTYLVGAQKTQWEKWSQTLRRELKLKGNDDAEKRITKTEALYLERQINEMKSFDSVTLTGSARARLRSYIDGLIGEHSPNQIGTWLDQIDAAHNKLVTKNKAHFEVDLKNQAIRIVEQMQINASEGQLIKLSDLNKAKKEIRSLLEQKDVFDEAEYNDLASKAEVQYARSIVSTVYRELSILTDNKGINPDRLSEIIAMNKDQLNALDKTTAEYKIGLALFEASKSFDAKSEVRTIINQIEEHNEKLNNNFNQQLQQNMNVDNVKIKGVNSTVDELKDYETSVYNNILGLPEGQSINFDDPELLMKDDVATEFGQQLQSDFAQGIITPQVRLALQKAALTGVASDNIFQLFNMGSGTSRHGDVLRIWHMDKNVDAKSIARLGASMLVFEAGLAASPQDALSQIVSNANELGGDIRKSLEVTIDAKLDKWILENYPEADPITRQRLLEASIALGSTATSSDDLKESLERWTEVTFGEDDMVIGNRLTDDKVSNARTKYINSDEMEAMNDAAYQLVYSSVSKEDQARLFKSIVSFYERPATVTNLSSRRTSVEQEGGPTIEPLFDLKYKESPSLKGVYYVYVKTDFGLQQMNKANGEPIVLNTADFKQKEEPHTYVSYYHTAYRSALQNDPNGNKNGNVSFSKMVGQVVGLIDKQEPAPLSQQTIDAERALVFSRFPERLNDPEMREVFDDLVSKGIILPEHVDEFLAKAGIIDD